MKNIGEILERHGDSKVAMPDWPLRPAYRAWQVLLFDSDKDNRTIILQLPSAMALRAALKRANFEAHWNFKKRLAVRDEQGVIVFNGPRHNLATGRAEDTYRGWTITYDPKPIPIRDYDWTATHPDYDASWEGEEDGWVDNGLKAAAGSREELCELIDELQDEWNETNGQFGVGA